MTPDSDWVIDALAQYERPLIRYAKWLLGDLESARDVVQETFLRLCKEDRRRVDGHLAPWLFTVCRNLAVDARKKTGRSEPLDNVELAVACDLDERHDARRLLDDVLDVLQTLPRNQREVVYLRFQGGLSYKDISAVTSLSVTNVGFLLHTAVRAIRRHLRPEPSCSPGSAERVAGRPGSAERVTCRPGSAERSRRSGT
jgi:RNA polymerase sigma-70 factor (ECF subfamily)